MSNKNQRRVQVTTGAAGVKQEPAKGDVQILVEEAAALAPRADGEVVYQSKAVNFRLQITAPARKYDPNTGVTEEQKPKVAQFSGGVFRTSDPEVIARLETRNGRKAPGFGFNLDYWRVEDAVEARRAADTEEFVAKLAADPEFRERVTSRLSALGDGFKLPTPPKPSSDEDEQ